MTILSKMKKYCIVEKLAVLNTVNIIDVFHDGN